ncbi:hypothetical protein [Winogradskyella flava]|uniref:hypothetical protein n=1 Tax=Winogradskyella flava TaxID=1884876 RepID=UPI00248F8E69|nr:hypothetical protein [Winogradskyella flava]
MKLNYLIIGLFFCFKCYSQDNTIFIIFEDRNDLLVEKRILNLGSEMKTIHYKYFFSSDKNDCESKNDNFWLRFSKYDDFDKLNAKEETLNFKINKSFIKKNKKILFSKKKFDNMGYCDTIEMLRKAQHIFLIDLEDIVNDKVTIKKVTLQEELSSPEKPVEIKEIKN